MNDKPTIETLVKDIYHLFDDDHIPEIPEDEIKALGERMVIHVRDAILNPERAPKLWMSNIGTKCRRKLWYRINKPEQGEKLLPHQKIKFLLGHIIEELALFLSRIAGHKVEREQERVQYQGVSGKIDAVIDDIVVDVKSASSRSFINFESGLKKDDDKFGYLDQLGLYRKVVTPNNRKAAFLAIEKQLGKMHLDVQEYGEEVDYDQTIADIKEAIALPVPPPRYYTDVPDGKSGNRKLGTECSYCDFKHLCWDNLKQYNYSSGPRYFTKVIREPRVEPEGNPFI